jgi:AAHS family 4-hydroxybenzoate transporter-like MFS transporter
VRYLALRPDRRDAVIRVIRKIAPATPIGSHTQFTLELERRQKVALSDLLRGPLAKLTPLLWITNLVSLLTFNSVNSWLPTILEGNGFTMEYAAIATTLFQFGGTFGCICIMRPLDRWGFLPVPVLFIAAIPILMSVGTPGLSVLVVMGLVFCAGFCLLGLQVGIIAQEAPAFPTGIRARGVGSCFAAGRIGSSIGPILVGALLGAQVSVQMLFVFAAAPLLVGFVSSSLITPLYRRHVRGIAAPVTFAEAVPVE